jgi:ATP-dependent DNA helicase RecG
MNLNSSVGELPMVGPIYQTRLQKMDIEKIKDLIYHLPNKYLDFRKSSKIGRVQIGDIVTIKGKIDSIKNQYTRAGKKLQIAEISDETGTLITVWFNQPFLIRTISAGDTLSLSGKVDWFGRKKALISPEFEKITEGGETLHTGKLIPVYPETYGLSSKWLRRKIKTAYDITEDEISEYLSKSQLKNINLVSLPQAIKSVHFPEDPEEAEKGRERLAFDELLFLQTQNLKRKSQWQKNKATYQLHVEESEIEKFTNSLPFKLTQSQEQVIREITGDLKKKYPMNRLLEGDVGSGKTVVAATAAFISFLNGYQTVIMAPTQILAQQHFDTLKSLLQPFKVRISLITSSISSKELGRNDIFVGTHALIHQNINFDKVALVVIDEQQKFGVEQREHLIRKVKDKNTAPHILTMTATPIPRTVALTFYGDLDLSTLNEIPKGRQKISTWIVPPQKRAAAYQWIDSQIASYKSRVFVVCPLIEESEKETMKSVKAVKKEYADLKKIFKGVSIGLLHGKQASVEKNKVVEAFKNGKTAILVATPVVEVGIDIPNATIMIIEAAERFGLAQLHQLRGRVGRSDKKSYCLLFSEAKGEKALARLSAMEKSYSGFELAELDLKLRGPGEIFGLRQHGIPDLKIASWQDINLIKKAKSLAEEIAN